MKVDGSNQSTGPDFNPQGSTSTTEDQITDALNVPVQAHDHKAANARRDSVRDIFLKLSPDEAKELYSRLEKYNHKDALTDKLYGTFSDETVDSLKKTLKSRFEPANGGSGETVGRKQPEKTNGGEKKSEVNNAGQSKAKDLNDQLNSKGPDAPLKIASRTDIDEGTKKSQINNWIRTASPADFQKMVEQSSSWPKDAQKIVDDVIATGGSGGNAERIVRDLKPDQQIEMVKRLQAGNYESAVHTVVGGADPTVLNRIAADFKSYPGFELDPQKSKGGSALTGMLAARAKDLTPDNQRKLADTLINHGMPQQALPDVRARNIREMFDSMSTPQSKDLFAHIQNNGDLKKMLANFQDPVNFQKEFLGLGKKELTAVKEAFEQLAAAQPKGSELQKKYLENARSASEAM